jgi:hypothetical protein
MTVDPTRPSRATRQVPRPAASAVEASCWGVKEVLLGAL